MTATTAPCALVDPVEVTEAAVIWEALVAELGAPSPSAMADFTGALTAAGFTPEGTDAP